MDAKGQRKMIGDVIFDLSMLIGSADQRIMVLSTVKKKKEYTAEGVTLTLNVNIPMN